MGKYELKLNWDRIAEARDLVGRWQKGAAVERTPYIYSVPAPDSKGWINGCMFGFGETAENPDKAVEGQIAAMNWQSETFPDSDWMPIFHLFHLGEGVVASMFGAIQKIDEFCPPFTKGRLLKRIEDVATLKERIDPDHDGWGPILKDNVLKFADATHGEVPVGVADHQSPYGCATKLLGNEALMLAMYDEPELVRRFLDLMVAATIDSVEAVKRWVGADLVCPNTSHPIPGEGDIIVWDDYVSVLTPALHSEFCAPANKQLFDRYGRGHLHTCGPYFPGYIDACLACGPATMDISAMRGMARSRGDLLEFRRLTAQAGVRLRGGLGANPVHQNDASAAQPWDEAFLRSMARDGLFFSDGGDADRGREVAALCRSIPQEAAVGKI